MNHQTEKPDTLAGISGLKTSSNKTPAILPDSEESCNFAMLAAKAKLRGHTLKKLTSGYLLFSWSLSRHFTEFADLVKALRQMGVKP